MVKDCIFKKPHTAIVMIPRVGKLTAMSRKLLNSMFHFAQQHLLSLPDSGKNFNAMDFFEEDMVELIRPIGSPTSNSLTVMKDHIMEMQSVVVNWTSPDQYQDIIWDSLVLVSQVKLRVEQNRIRVMWSFPPDIVRSLAMPEFYTVVRLRDLAALSGYVAVALYEIVLRYASSPTNLTSKKPKQWWVAALTSDSHRRSFKDKNEPVLRDWRLFKHEKVLPAINEINIKTGVYIELIEHKNGRLITDVQFRVHRTKGEKVVQPRVPSGPCFTAAAKLGISQRDISHCLDRPVDPYTEDQVLLALAKIEARINNPKPGALPVKNVSAYFKKIMLETVAPPLFAGRDSAAIVSVDMVSSVSTAGSQIALPVTAKQHPAQQLMPNIEPPSSRTLLARKFLSLPVDEQRIYALAARDKLLIRGLLSPVINRKIETGSWSTGVVLDEILQDFSKKQDPLDV